VQNLKNQVILGNNLIYLKTIPDNVIDLIYIDPPFNTGNIQKRGSLSYKDSHKNYKKFITKRLVQAYRVLKSNGSLFFHIDWREAHYCKIWLDKIFGRDNFIGDKWIESGNEDKSLAAIYEWRSTHYHHDGKKYSALVELIVKAGNELADDLWATVNECPIINHDCTKCNGCSAYKKLLIWKAIVEQLYPKPI